MVALVVAIVCAAVVAVAWLVTRAWVQGRSLDLDGRLRLARAIDAQSVAERMAASSQAEAKAASDAATVATVGHDQRLREVERRLERVAFKVGA